LDLVGPFCVRLFDQDVYETTARENAWKKEKVAPFRAVSLINHSWIFHRQRVMQHQGFTPVWDLLG